MRTNVFRISALTVAILVSAVADRAASHKLSSLAVNSFTSAVGSVVNLVSPPAEPAQVPEQRVAKIPGRAFTVEQAFKGQRDEQRATPDALPTVAPADQAVMLPEPEATALIGSATSSQSQQQANASSGYRARRSPSNSGGVVGSMGAGSRGRQGTQPATPAETDTPFRTHGLMALVMDELTGETAPVASSLGRSDFARRPSGVSAPENSGSRHSGSRNVGSPSGSSSTPADRATKPTGESSVQESAAPWLDSFPQPTPAELFPAPTDTITAIMIDALPMSAGLIPAGFVPPTLDAGGLDSVVFVDRIDLAEEPPMIVNPEPATLLLLGTGLVLAATGLRRRIRDTLR